MKKLVVITPINHIYFWKGNKIANKKKEEALAAVQINQNGR